MEFIRRFKRVLLVRGVESSEFEKPDFKAKASAFFERMQGWEKLLETLTEAESNYSDVFGRSPTLPELKKINDRLCKITQTEIDGDWYLFKSLFERECNNNLIYETIPDEVYTVKCMIGANLVQSATVRDWPWVLKEARLCWELINKNKSLIHPDPIKYKQIGNSSMLVNQKKEDSSFRTIGELLQEYRGEK